MTEMTYYITIDVRTKKALSEEQRDKLREAILEAIDEADMPYGADAVTAELS